MSATDDHEAPLEGGITNAGRVSRDGAHVVRPATPHTESTHAFLRAIAATGFRGAPVPVGLGEDGRERLHYIEGDVPRPPYPGWSQSDTALTSVARLLRDLHAASRHFDPTDHVWPSELADPAGGSIICHNDVELSNVVFHNGMAVALIDFEFAAPGRPVYDLAQFAHVCVPIEHEIDQARMGWRPADRPRRARLIADAYGLDRAERPAFLDAIDDALARIEHAARLADLHGSGASAATGGIEKYDRRREWWHRHRPAFAAALA